MNVDKQSSQVIPFVLYFLFLNCLSFSEIYYVNWNCQGDGSSWEHSFQTLQQALDVVEPGDEIWVAAGIYYPTNSYGMGGDRFKHFKMKSGVGIYGGFWGTETDREHRDVKANQTILSGDIGRENDPADNCYHVFYHEYYYYIRDASTILDGFTITGGNANGNYGNSQGGGIHNRAHINLTIIDCTFVDNFALKEGGAMYNQEACNINLKNCIFENNKAEYGAGLYNYDIISEVTHCVFRNNEAKISGGGMLNDRSEVTIADCLFVDNTANDYYGGGICNNTNTIITITDCVFQDNHAKKGGGMQQYGPYSKNLTNRCVFIGNTAYQGAGAYTYWGSFDFSNCIFSGNVALDRGGALYNGYQSRPVLTNCTLSQNQANYGGGISNQNGTVFVKNSILWNNSAISEGNEIYFECNMAVCEHPRVSHCNIQGCGGSGPSWVYLFVGDGGGNIDMIPEFVDPDGFDGISGTADDNLKLMPNSPCIDTGGPDSDILPDATDLDGNPRIDNGIVDMGAYEYIYPLHVWLDIKPQSCPNPLNVNSKGVLSAAILGSDVFDVNQINPASILLGGISPIHWSLEDVATPNADPSDCACNIDDSDGYLDLSLKFDTQEIAAALGEVEDGEMWMLYLTGSLYDDTQIEGTDCIEIIKKTERN